MKNSQKNHLATALVDIDSVLALDLPQWSLLVSQARRANVLARLGFLLEEAGLLEKIPVPPRLHITSMQRYASRFDMSLKREIACIYDVLKTVDVPLILLKGSAYFAAGNKASKGRIFSDVDILVPEDKLSLVETALIKGGWMTDTLDPYDQKYYRQWMHEIPPMRHLKRQTTIDVHHNILPKTSECCPDANKLLANIEKVSGEDCWVLAPEDRVLHSASHLFYGGEWDHGFRDLSDLDLLIKEFSAEEGFWVRLMQRAEALHQQIPLYYALRYAAKLFQTLIPEDVVYACQMAVPCTIRQKLMDQLFIRALQPNHQSYNDRWRELACWLLFVRSHWLRMPFYLIVPHLVRKGLRGFQGNNRH